MFGASDFGFSMRHEFGGTLWDARESYERQSPLNLAHKVTTPTLVIHSEQDLRCPMNQGQEFYTILKMRGVPTRLVLYPEESHDLSRGGRPDRRIDRLERIRDWMDRYLMESVS
jgi:dipeptidyl aminopeptidase/acylaminoacyl peptidase